MAENVDNLILEHLKKIQAEQGATRERDREMLQRLGQIETKLASMGGEIAHGYQERIDDRHSVDALRLRVDRIERRLELES